MNDVAVFPGQGSQHVGMGKDLFENFASVRMLFEEASESIHTNIKRLCFDGPESDLTLTENTQPCLLTVSVAAFQVAQNEVGYQPKLVLGHSLGEYSALVAGGALSFSTAVRWVKARGKAMQSAVPVGEGTMAAVLGLEDEQVSELCKIATALATEKRKSQPDAFSIVPWVEPANFNAPGQVAIAGSMDAVEELLRLLKSGDGLSPELKKGKGIPLSVSAPFHSQLMSPARDSMASLFTEQLKAQPQCIQPLKIAYIPNRTARPTQETSIIIELLLEQIDHAVKWRQSIEAALKIQPPRITEFGPGKVLSGLNKRIIQHVSSTHEVALAHVGDTATLQKLGAYK